MNIKKENIDDFLRCNICSAPTFNRKFLHSLKCDHKLCEDCFRSFSKKEKFEDCKICNTSHTQSDYSYISEEEKYIERDDKFRKAIMNIYYKVEEDFSNKEEYENYLEEIENLVQNCEDISLLVKEIQRKMQNVKLDSNKVKREEYLKYLDTIKKQRDPGIIYNSKKLDSKEETLVMSLDPSLVIMKKVTGTNYSNVKFPVLDENSKITIIRNFDLMVKSGGYNNEKIYEDLANYAGLGF